MKEKYYVAIVAILLSCGCKKSTESIFTSSSYPLAIGNTWEYQLTVCNGNISKDTFVLSIVSLINSGPYTQYMCNFTGAGTTVPAGYFLQSDTSMAFINSSSYSNLSPFPNFHLKFPVAAGRYWQGSFPGDSILVDAVVGSESYYGHTYSPCYLTNESYDLPHNFKVENMILTPKVGLVHESINYQSDTADVNGTAGVDVCQSIDLINYHVQ